MKRLFLDMDGCLARFYEEKNYLDRMCKKGFFKNLKPYSEMLEALEIYSYYSPDVELYILSACPDSEFAKEEKNEWLAENFPVKNRIFMRAGENKASFVPDISRDDYLLDDHTKNLFEWEAAGGTGIKVKNEVNCKNGTWKGAVINGLETSEEILEKLEEIIDEN